ncbi:MAG: hypothetical protein RL264_217 [Bacteroidota bacterium]|jgi:DNA gyrase/topoisomerase IV subunit A
MEIKTNLEFFDLEIKNLKPKYSLAYTAIRSVNFASIHSEVERITKDIGFINSIIKLQNNLDDVINIIRNSQHEDGPAKELHEKFEIELEYAKMFMELEMDFLNSISSLTLEKQITYLQKVKDLLTGFSKEL